MDLPTIEGIPNLSKKRKIIRVVIADDHPLVRESLKMLLAREQDIQVVGEAADGREALDCVRQLAPDVLLLDLRMPNLDGFAVLKALHPIRSDLKVIVMTASEDKTEFVRAMQMGCSGIVLKQSPLTLITRSIRRVSDGEIWLDSHTTAAVMAQFSTTGDSGRPEQKQRLKTALSKRQREIAILVSKGSKNKEIAESLGISEQTTKNHLHSIFEKLGISDRLELALYAIHHKWHLY